MIADEKQGGEESTKALNRSFFIRNKFSLMFQAKIASFEDMPKITFAHIKSCFLRCLVPKADVGTQLEIVAGCFSVGTLAQ